VAGAAAAVLLLGASCRRDGAGPAGSADPLAEAGRLVEQGRFDDAVALIGANSDPEALHLLGRAWMGKALSAPVPTPGPGSATPSGALLKVEEEQALGFLERAVAARPDHAGAQLALAELLAPHALALAAAPGRAGAPS
jgi:hypothetical protein